LAASRCLARALRRTWKPKALRTKRRSSEELTIAIKAEQDTGTLWSLTRLLNLQQPRPVNPVLLLSHRRLQDEVINVPLSKIAFIEVGSLGVYAMR